MQSKKIALLVYITLLPLSALSMTFEKDTSYIISQKIKNNAYELNNTFIRPWFSLTEIPGVVLKVRGKSQKTLATFQLPKTLEENDYPKFSDDNKYLLILNTPWSLFYNPAPKYYEWNLFDIEKQKVIKKFPHNDYPSFAKDNTIKLNNKTEISLEKKQNPIKKAIAAKKLALYQWIQQLKTSQKK